MNVRQAESQDLAAWDRFVDQHPSGGFFHLSGWKNVNETIGHLAPYLLAEQGGDIVGLLPLTIKKSLVFGRSMQSTSFCVLGGPLAINDAVEDQLDAAAWALAQQHGISCLEYRSEKARAKDGWTIVKDRSAVFRHDLAQTEDEILASVRRTQRRIVRKSLEIGLETKVENNIDLMHHLYAVSVRGLGTPVFPKKLFTALLAEFGDKTDIIVTRNADGDPIASVLNFYYKGMAMPYYGGYSAESRALHAPNHIYYKVMCHAAQSRGCTMFDFGRSPIDSGPYNFKKNWGFDPIVLEYAYRLPAGEKVPAPMQQSRKFQIASQAWAKLPLWITKIAGPPLAKYLG